MDNRWSLLSGLSCRDSDLGIEGCVNYLRCCHPDAQREASRTVMIRTRELTRIPMGHRKDPVGSNRFVWRKVIAGRVIAGSALGNLASPRTFWFVAWVDNEIVRREVRR